MKELIEINHFPVSLQLSWRDGDIEGVDVLGYDGLQGVLSRADWLRDDEVLGSYPSVDQDRILSSLDLCSNDPFFMEDEIET